ncbi:proteasome ATPase, partial [Streptomyces sp. SID10244]|nr:proteasome ATPase [Streptomyces sp. SID10244]
MTESDRQGASGADRLGSSGAHDDGSDRDESAQMPEESFIPAYASPVARPDSQRSSFARPADPKDLQERVDNLTARNAKLLDTLKEARQQLVALREEVDRLGQPPSGYGVLLDIHPDSTVDVFTSGRKMRLTCSPNIDVESLSKGQTLRLNEALTIVEACEFDSVGEISTLREI